MNDTVALALIGMVGTTVSAIISAYVFVRTGRIETKQTQIEAKVDGKMDALLDASIGRATAEGITSGEAAERERGRVEGPAAPVSVAFEDPQDVNVVKK